MANAYLTDGSVWRLYAHGREIARLTVTGMDFPWVIATIETLPGFEDFRPLFDKYDHEIDAEDWEAADDSLSHINESITMTKPDGTPVAEFLLNVHGDGTAWWRWLDEPIDLD